MRRLNTTDLLMKNCGATELWDSGQVTESSAKPLLVKTRCTVTAELLTKKEKKKKGVRFLHCEIIIPLVYHPCLELELCLSVSWLEE